MAAGSGPTGGGGHRAVVVNEQGRREVDRGRRAAMVKRFVSVKAEDYRTRSGGQRCGDEPEGCRLWSLSCLVCNWLREMEEDQKKERVGLGK